MEKFPLKGGRSIVTPASNSTSYQSVTKKQVRKFIHLFCTNTNQLINIIYHWIVFDINTARIYLRSCDLFASESYETNVYLISQHTP